MMPKKINKDRFFLKDLEKLINNKRLSTNASPKAIKMGRENMKYKKEITIKELREIIGKTIFEAQFNFWQKASDFQKGLCKNLKEKGYKI